MTTTDPLVPLNEETPLAPGWEGYSVALPNGDFVVYWESIIYVEETGYFQDFIKAQRFDSSGQPLGEITTLFQNNWNVHLFPPAIFPDGTVGIPMNVFDESTNTSTLMMMRTDPSGLAIDTTLVLEGEVSRPRMTVLEDGGFVMTWSQMSADPDSNVNWEEVYAHRFDADGNPVGDAFQVNTFTVDTQAFQDIASLSDGGFIVTWESYGQDGDRYGVFAQRFDAQGQPVGPEFQVNTTTVDNQYYMTVTGLKNGGFVVLWEDNSLHLEQGTRIISGQLYNANGEKSGEEFSITNPEVYRMYDPEVAALPDGGFVVVMKMGFFNSGDEWSVNWDVMLQRYDADGQAMGEPLLIHAPSGAEQGKQQIVVNADGHIMVVWNTMDENYNTTLVTRVFDIGYEGPSNSAPLASADLVTTDEDVPLTLLVTDLLANDSDPDGEALSITSLFDAQHGQVTLNDDGTIQFVADANFNGEASFRYTISDPDGATAEALVTVAVAAVYDPLVTQADALSPIGALDVLQVNAATLLANDQEGDGGALAIASVGNAVGGYVTLADGLITFMPDFTFSGLASFQYEAIDGVLGAGSGIWETVAFQVEAPAGMVTGGDSGVKLSGGKGNDTILGGAGDDKISGGDSNDTLMGGAGNDTLSGGKGDDTFLVQSGDGIDTFSGGTGFDTLRVLGDGDLTLGQFTKGDLELIDGGPWWDRAITGTDGKDQWDFSATTLKGFTTLDGGAGDDRIVGSADGETLLGGAGKDHLLGGGGDDVLNGGAGNDLLTGGTGSDIYQFGHGDGRDLIDNLGAGGDNDWILFGANIAPDQLWFQMNGDDLVVSILGTADQMTVQDWGLGPQNHVDGFVTSDGSTLSEATTGEVVTAMAAFAPPPEGQTELTQEQHQALDDLLAASWHSIA